MTARVLVVDDIPANVKLLEAKLTAEYFDVSTAFNGREALEAAAAEKPDIILLDVMMPEMDGFEVCRRLKSRPETQHIPVIMVTALDQPTDRVTGLEAGADDFLTKPVDDIALMARVRSLVRLKLMTDELRMRETTSDKLGLMNEAEALHRAGSGMGRILVVEDRETSARRIAESLRDQNRVTIESDAREALVRVGGEDYDLVVVSLSLERSDGLRFCSHLRSEDRTRNVPILAIVENGDTARLVRALDMGVNDYLMRPVDRNELTARVRTQLKRKRYQDVLRQNLQLSLEMAITDPLTNLYNRRYMESHLGTLVQRAADRGKPISLLIVDIDFFKSVNDTHGHDVGDEVLREFGERLARNVRGIDLACRYGGEEFVVVMPDTDVAFANAVAERLRTEIASLAFQVSTETGRLDITASIGVTALLSPNESVDQFLKRADKALYRAKREGRNRVVSEAA
ncbi:PleD family two-component system response regulator [Pyruvatibacter sp.]|uniref:PleD family two-component system response regulator n=1 Tax=Pyruvatibacter sp. TaxID=1981328 RepID=UPI0032EDDC34